MSGIYSTLKRLSKTALHTNDELERRYTMQSTAKDLFQLLLQEGESSWFSQQTQSQPQMKETADLPIFFIPNHIVCSTCGRFDCVGMNCYLTDNLSECGILCSCSLCSLQPEKKTAVKSPTQEIALLGSKPVRCNCKHSGCVKKYCQCYKLGQECGKDCGCLDCGNKGHQNKETKIVEEC